jgi:hypothetical protein
MTQDQDQTIDGAQLLSSLVGAEEFFPCAIRRPGVGITDPQGKWINRLDQLVELLSQPDLKAERVPLYTGDPETTVWNVRLPAEWSARVAYVKFADLPERARLEIDAVVLKQVGQEAVLLARSIPPLHAENLRKEYNSITLKLQNGRLVAWIPGLDKRSGSPCANLSEQFVLLGNHYKKNNK